ncbi:MAG: 5-formyltetrahydrofolate cyclo-ligase [Candidatus Nanohaloarchaea archaeon]
MTAGTSTDKETVRDRMRERRADLPPAARDERSRDVLRAVADLDRPAQSDTVFVYVSTGNEVRTGPLIDDLLDGSGTVAVPVMVDGEMHASVLHGRDELEPGRFGLPQPADDSIRRLPPDDIDVAVVPGVAFDTEGNRIGRGSGHYDRYLPSVDGPAIGLAYRFQVVDRIDPDPWDVPVDTVVTEDGPAGGTGETQHL